MSARENDSPSFESRSERVRDANDRIAAQARVLHFVSRVPMLCECADDACRELFLVALERYEEIRNEDGLFLTTPAHAVGGAAEAFSEGGYRGMRVLP